MNADSTIPRPPHYCWVDVTNLPADEVKASRCYTCNASLFHVKSQLALQKLVIKELKKFGRIMTLQLMYPVRDEVRVQRQREKDRWEDRLCS
ncbi:hypothetical protein RvY_00551 [Ramazzottius varieornatus]|uniref:Uncharacterized protein n=1 Tax=Ramazzottius varieornatus TaxID=947166 RepID=A0A1D1UDM5_RAMVA|nr:hypothetical protein RvY_00551 [Ramazzottius varieornatus]